eukprot:CAMPEP_0195272472 /NCGR_PEP_ID=MMETSP0706-20130129/15817_1 /TAXON_ID=33640 /ORGANISM="Asterionellopsis glacialis, Strain CCMP134" /LENGTH=46 /DNA_ID= /DNA_START= /DNA_END= /DNA_ORIENTATION=
MAVAAQVAQDDGFTFGLVFAGHRLDRLQRRLIHHAATGKINDHTVR